MARVDGDPRPRGRASGDAAGLRLEDARSRDAGETKGPLRRDGIAFARDRDPGRDRSGRSLFRSRLDRWTPRRPADARAGPRDVERDPSRPARARRRDTAESRTLYGRE